MKIHGTWPPERLYPGFGKPQEEQGWHDKMQEFENEARGLDHKWKWERWLEVAQMRLAKNYTESGWVQMSMDPKLHEKALKHYKKEHEQSRMEHQTPFYIQGRTRFWDKENLPGTLSDDIVNDIKAKIAKWANVREQDLDETSTYGFRIYQDGAVLKPHVDRVESHVLSAVYCLDIEDDLEPWHLEAASDFTGVHAKVDLRPGQLFLYESAKLPHGRPGIFRGKRYVALFSHFKPREWRFQNVDRVYALPPWWRDPLDSKDDL